MTSKPQTSGSAAKAVLNDDNIILEYEAVRSGAGYVRPAVLLEFGARSKGEPAERHRVTCEISDAINDLQTPIANPRVIRAERTFWEKPIDFRPYVVISVVSALLVATQDLLAAQGAEGATVDPTRVMQGVITGIVFVGAGAMYRDGDFVKGAGTAASIWSAGALGLICGIGEIWLAGMITVTIVVLMLASAPFTARWDSRSSD